MDKSVYNDTAIILLNLGSPDSSSVSDVKHYLKEFLMDERVIDIPYVRRYMLINGIIAPFRAPKSAEAYRSIWTSDGSPLVVITKKQQRALGAALQVPVVTAMRYGNPTMKSAYDLILKEYPNVKRVVNFPLYPHYAMSSYATAVAHAEAVHKNGNYPFSISFVAPFYKHPAFVTPLTESIRKKIDESTHVLFSYHSIPERQVRKCDVTGSHCLNTPDCCSTASRAHEFCYRHQCFETTRSVVARLGLSPDQYSVSFQSKLGRAEWLKPPTTAVLHEMPSRGLKKLAVVCPAFVSDCLETLEEINIRERANFMQSGGEAFTFIECLNDSATWINGMADLVSEHLSAML